MDICYLANIRLPTEKAHGIQIMKTCEALAHAGVKLELLVAQRKNPLQGSPFAFYAVEQCFKVHHLHTTDFLRWPLPKFFGFLLQSYSFFRSAVYYIRHHPAKVYYTRDLVVAALLPMSFSPLFYEIHTLPDRPGLWHRRAWRRSMGIIVISNGLRDDLLKLGVAAEKIVVARDAVDIRQFQIPESQEQCRVMLGLPQNQKMVVYTGHLYEWKGAGTLAEASDLLPKDIHVYLVGGTEHDVETFKKKYQSEHVHIVGWQTHALIPYWLKAADVLVLPTSGKERIGSRYTSPLKLFEYIAAGRPIVASDISSLREVLLGTGRATFVKADTIDAIARGIKEIFEKRQGITLTVGEDGLSVVDWKDRARQILDFIGSL